MMGSKLAVFALDFLLLFAAVAIAGSAWAMAPMVIMSITSYFRGARMAERVWRRKVVE